MTTIMVIALFIFSLGGFSSIIYFFLWPKYYKVDFYPQPFIKPKDGF